MQTLTSGVSTTYAVALYRVGAYAEAVTLIKVIGLNVQRVRNGREWSQTVLAKRINALDPSFAPLPGQISDWERARYNSIELKNLMLLATALECSMDALVAGADERYDAVAKLPPPAPSPLTDEDRELLALVRDRSTRRILRLLEKQEQAELRSWLLTKTDPEEESTLESNPGRQAEGGATPRKRGRTASRAGGKGE